MLDAFDSTEDLPPLRSPATKRLIDLVLLLQSTRRGYTKAEILTEVEGYGDPESASTARMFERDKRQLLGIGISIELLQPDVLHPDEVRYRVLPENALLPEVSFTEGERAALCAALAIWQTPNEAREAREAKLKLEALGVDLPTVSVPIELKGSFDLQELLLAIAARRVVRFTYRKPDAGEPSERNVEAWGIACRSGSYFVYGFDRARKDVRVFNLARVCSAFSQIGEEGAYEIPTSLDVTKVLAWEGPEEQAPLVKIQIDAGKGAFWRKRIATAEALKFESGEFEFALTSPFTMIPQLAADSPHVVVLEPAEIRASVASLLGVDHGAA